MKSTFDCVLRNISPTDEVDKLQGTYSGK